MKDPRIAALEALLRDHARVAIVGAPRTGKTWLADHAELEAARAGRRVLYSDDFKHLAWADVPAAIIKACEMLPRFLLEGVQVARALRRGLEVDAVMYLDDPKAPQLVGQKIMGKGIATVFDEWRAARPTVHVVSPDRVPPELIA